MPAPCSTPRFSCRRPRISIAASFLALLALGLTAHAGVSFSDQVSLPAIQDNTIYSESDSSYGAGLCLQVGRPGLSTQFNPWIRRVLLLFDLTSIPAGSNIVSARLDLFRFQPGGPGEQIFVHRLMQEWGEGTSGEGFPCTARPRQVGRPPTESSSTWNYSFYGPQTVWQTESGDTVHGGYFRSAFSDSDLIYPFVSTVSLESSGLTSDVADWIRDPGSNHGWILRGDETIAGTGMRFASREDLTLSLPPTLTVFFTPPTGACCKPDGTCDLLTRSECDAQSGSYGGDNSTCAQLVCLTPYVDSLPIPRLALPRGRKEGRRDDDERSGRWGSRATTYEIAMREFKQKLHRDLPATTLWGYDGQYPGPTIEAERDEPVRVRWINDLRNEYGVPRTQHYFQVDTRIHGPDAFGSTPRTVVHLHGGRVPPESDGYPESTLVSGQSVDYFYPNHQLPTTLWYHDHALGITRYNVLLGLAGFYLIRDREEKSLQLPRGRYEIPLLVQDRSFNSDGSLFYPDRWTEAFAGDKVLVNGKVWPYLRVDQGKYRFRVLNGSNHRIYTFSLSDGRAFDVIGSDGGLLGAPVSVHQIVLGPAERADIVVDFGGDPAGSEILFQNSDPTEPLESGARRVMKFVVSGNKGWTAPLPARLRPVPRIPESEAVRTRTFQLRRVEDPVTGTKFRFGEMGWDEITEFPVLGSTEIWAFANTTGDTHPIHIHLVQFQILDRGGFTVDGGNVVPVGPRIPPAPEEAGWKDTAKVPPGQMLRVIMRFTGYTGDYVFHCHMLEHEDNDMMRQFTVVPRGCRGPSVAAARAVPSRLWPPDLTMAPVNITGIEDSTGDPVSIHITGVMQDEAVSHLAQSAPTDSMPMDGAVSTMHHRDRDDSCVDAVVDEHGQLFLRRERQDGGNGRVYLVTFTAATRRGGTSDGSVLVAVPKEEGIHLAVNDGLVYNSLEGCIARGGHEHAAARLSGERSKVFSTALGIPRLEAGRAMVEYSLAEPSEVSLAIFNVAGRRVASVDEVLQEPGYHKASLPIGHLSHGIYFMRMRAGRQVFVRRLPVLGTRSR